MITGTQHNTTQQPNRPCHLNRTATAHRTISRPQQPPMQPWLATESHIDTHLRLHATKRQKGELAQETETALDTCRIHTPAEPAPAACDLRRSVPEIPCHSQLRPYRRSYPPCRGSSLLPCWRPFLFAFAPKYLFLLSTRPLVPSWPYKSSTTPSKDTKPTSFLLLKTRPIPPL